MKLSSLMPREDKFSVLLNDLSREAHETAKLLKSYVEKGEVSRRAELGAQISAKKQRAKDLMSTITKSLCQTYMTPFDREDIQGFSVNLYKIVKTIDKVRERIDLHGIDVDDGSFLRQIDLICREGVAMNEMVEALCRGKANKFVIAKTDELLDLESKGDALLAELLVDLFKNEPSARELILRKDIYDMLEKVIDRYRDAGSIAVEIVLKHS